MWQTGSFYGFVTAAEIPIGELVTSPELGADPSDWNVNLKDRAISGRVYDATTGEPIANARVSLAALLSDATAVNSNLRTDEAGTYRVFAAKPGEYRLTVTADAYLTKTQAVTVQQDDAGKTLNFGLSRGASREIRVTWSGGGPIADAAILEASQGSGMPTRVATTDAVGIATVTGSIGQQRTLYVIPKEGSFAILRVVMKPDDSSEPLQAMVPAPRCSLEVNAVDDAGSPVNQAFVLIRYNGDIVAPEITDTIYGEMFTTNGNGRAVLSRLPYGSYDVWIARTRAERVFMYVRSPRVTSSHINIVDGQSAAIVVRAAAPLETKPLPPSPP